MAGRNGHNGAKDRAHWKRLLLAGPIPCVRCGREVHLDDTWHVDHIIALAEGGAAGVDNQGVSHARCNTRHGQAVGKALERARKQAPPRVRPITTRTREQARADRAARRLRPWPGVPALDP